MPRKYKDKKNNIQQSLFPLQTTSLSPMGNVNGTHEKTLKKWYFRIILQGMFAPVQSPPEEFSELNRSSADSELSGNIIM